MNPKDRKTGNLTRRSFVRRAAATGLLVSAGPGSVAETQDDALAHAFVNPPDASRPWVYWWWLQGNVSREGITCDLEEMKRQGINGVLLFHAGGGDGVPPGPPFLSTEWRGLFRFALDETSRLGMEMSLNLCDGWDSGGPWIRPEEAAKKLVYSEVQADGPAGSLHLPLPPVVGDYYREVAVVAFRERSRHPVQPAAVEASSTVTGYCDEWNWPPADIVDSDPNTFWRSNPKEPPTPERPQWVAWRYHGPLAARAIYLLSAANAGPDECVLQASVDGSSFHTITTFRMERGAAKRVEFPEISATHFRLLIRSAHQPDVQLCQGWLLREGDEPMERPGVQWWRFKSGNRSFWDYPKQGTAALDEEYPDDGKSDLDSGGVLDLTSHLGEDGTLDWKVPEGRWTILRFGYTLLGQMTRASSTDKNGYECDMMDRRGIERHFESVAVPALEIAGAEVGRTLKYVHIDSYELGADVRGQQPTWTAAFREEFRTRRGYDLLPYLPALAQRLVDSRERTGRFLWDVRRTIGDLVADCFYQRLGELAHARGVGMHCETGYGTYPQPHIDGLQCAGRCDVTMGEFWHGTDIMSQFDPFCNVIRSVASAAHVYGRRIVQAEAFTSWNHFRESPARLKAVGDAAFCDGLNRMVVHQYTHQPKIGGKPGIQYGAGTHLDRNLTWWQQSGPWLKYLGRCEYLLAQGRFHADICYFYGEGATSFVPGRDHLRPALPRGYNYDCINAEVLLNGVKIVDRKLLVPGGTSYQVLVLPESPLLSPRILRRLQELIGSGVTVLGSRPAHAPGLGASLAFDSEVRELSDALWGPAVSRSGDRRIGKGRLIWGKGLVEALAGMPLAPDFEANGGTAGTRIDFIHRSLPGAEVYFLSNQRDRAERLECVFRAAGAPELWDPVSGIIHVLPEYRGESLRISVPLTFEPHQSCFIVFRKGTGAAARSSARNYPGFRKLMEIEGRWQVAFDPQWGGPERATFERLEDWTNRLEDGIRHYSGKAVYRKTLELPAAPARLFLNLGTAHEIAEVRVNGKDLGVLWCAPWRIEITGAIRAGRNLIEIAVVNLWCNRLIGDARLPPERRVTDTNLSLSPDLPLMPSGLLGPVWIEQQDWRL